MAVRDAACAAQATVDAERRIAYIVSFPNNETGAVVWSFDADSLEVRDVWRPAGGLDLFDLQATPARGVLFGIAVDGRYGRILSQFSFVSGSDDVGVQHLFRLPYMWYVNASSLDLHSMTYFGLINHFPGPNATTAQQLVVGKFADVSHPSATVVPLQANGYTVHFISHSPVGTLVALALHATERGAHFLIVDPSTGALVQLGSDADAVAIGPLVADPSTPEVCAFLEYANGPRFQQACIDLNWPELTRTPVSGDEFGIFAAATTGFY